MLEVILVGQGDRLSRETGVKRGILKSRTHLALQSDLCGEFLDVFNRQGGPIGALPILLNHNCVVRDVVNRLAATAVAKVNRSDSSRDRGCGVARVREVEVVLGRILRHLVRIDGLRLNDVVQRAELIYAVVVYGAFVTIRDIELAVGPSRVSCHSLIGRRITGPILVRREFDALDRHVRSSIKLREVIGVGRVVVGVDNVRGLLRNDLCRIHFRTLARIRIVVCIHRPGGDLNDIIR